MSIIKLPDTKVVCDNSASQFCQYEKAATVQKHIKLPVKTLPTIVKELGHVGRKIDVLKVDVEGSEYALLEHLFDTYGCPDFIEQLTLEWHHFSFDTRYGEGSSPAINALTTMLEACGLKQFWVYGVGWTTNVRLFHQLGIGKDVRYNLGSFHRVDASSAPRAPRPG